MAKMEQLYIDLPPMKALITYKPIGRGVSICDVFLEHEGVGMNILRGLSPKEVDAITDTIMETIPT